MLTSVIAKMANVLRATVGAIAFLVTLRINVKGIDTSGVCASGDLLHPVPSWFARVDGVRLPTVTVLCTRRVTLAHNDSRVWRDLGEARLLVNKPGNQDR